MATTTAEHNPHDQSALTGDLQSVPRPERRLFGQDAYALEWAIPLSGAERPMAERALVDTLALMESELANADPLLDASLRHHLGPQFRSRPDTSRAAIAVEQWLPALNCWMVNGYFDRSCPVSHIISTLEAGDPRKRTPEEHLADQREAAAAKRESNDKASTDRVLGAIDALTSRQVENFVAVEQAMHTGENITVRGDDRRTIESLTESTRKAAYSGDVEAQNVITRGGQSDNPTCVLPSTNPLRHRHRSERG